MLHCETRIESRREELRRVVALTEQFGAENHLPNPIINDIQVVLDEVLSNIIAYGYEASACGAIVVRLACQNDELRIEVEDEGHAFDPLQAPQPDLGADLAQRQVGGLGIHFIKSLMDTVCYDRRDGKNLLRMLKRVPAELSLTHGKRHVAAEQSGMPTTTGPRVLVVDDNDDNRYTLTTYLDLEGYQNVVTANDGEEAVALLETESFDLVLLDVMMPRLDGFGVLAWLKAKGRLHHLPVIMISAQNEIENVVRCIELGAVDYLTKPFNKVLLRARLGSSLEKKRLRDQVRAHLARLERELDAARRLQMGMVPQSFPPSGPAFPWDIHASIAPALEVGGDLYDVFCAPNGDLCFFIGDVSGKGMPAALFMARTKSLIRVVTELTARAAPADPAAIVTRVNLELCDGNAEVMFVTLFFGVLSPDGRLAYCNAGHNPPYRIGGATVSALAEAAGLVLGVEPSADYQTARAQLGPGDTLLLYTDGVTEAFNVADEPFGEARLEAALARAAPTSAALIAAVAADVAAFVGSAPRSDDIAMLALRRVSA